MVILNAQGNPYRAAEMNRLTAHLPVVSYPTAEELRHGTLRILRVRSRFLVQNHPHACGAIRHIVRRVCGAGLRIQARLRSTQSYRPFLRDENRFIERTWREHARRGQIGRASCRERV